MVLLLLNLEGKWAKIAVKVGTKNNVQVRDRASTVQGRRDIEDAKRKPVLSAVDNLSSAVVILAEKAKSQEEEQEVYS